MIIIVFLDFWPLGRIKSTPAGLSTIMVRVAHKLIFRFVLLPSLHTRCDAKPRIWSYNDTILFLASGSDYNLWIRGRMKGEPSMEIWWACGILQQFTKSTRRRQIRLLGVDWSSERASERMEINKIYRSDYDQLWSRVEKYRNGFDKCVAVCPMGCPSNHQRPDQTSIKRSLLYHIQFCSVSLSNDHHDK